MIKWVVYLIGAGMFTLLGASLFIYTRMVIH